MVSIHSLRFASLQPVKAHTAHSPTEKTPKLQARDSFTRQPHFGSAPPSLETVQGRDTQKVIQDMLARVDFLKNPNTDKRENVVAHVADGDTFTIEVTEKSARKNNAAVHKETIRLFGTDAQEAPPVLPQNPTPAHHAKIAKVKELQPYGEAAKVKLKNLIDGKPVRIYIKDIDQHQRIVAGAMVDKKPWLPGGWVDVAEEMLKAGMTMAYPNAARLASLRQFITTNYVPLQKRAKAAGIGMFQHPDPMPGWIYRSQHKQSIIQGN